jgi:PKD repeat protein
MEILKYIVVLSMIAFLFAGCEKAQEGAPKGVSYISVEEIQANDTQVPTVPSLGEGNATPEAQPEQPSETPPIPPAEVPPVETPPEQPPAEAVPPETEKPKEIVIVAKETDLVSLQPVAYDPDKDTLKFTYSTPLNATGKWQTTYGDAGQYTITITASDGELTTTKDALLIINKKEEAPSIDSKSPDALVLESRENTKIEFSVQASDLNKDPLTYAWKLDGQEVSTTTSYEYVADYDSSGSHTVKLDVSDGTTSTSLIWSLTLENVDRPPVLKPIQDITVKETETITIVPEATDPDKEDTITYEIKWPEAKETSFEDNIGVWKTTYEDAGVYSIEVTASDGTLSDTQTVKATVINVNRPPVIDNIVQI